MDAIFQILQILLNVVWWIIIQAIMSWLVAFNVINTHNDFIRQLFYALDRMTEQRCSADSPHPRWISAGWISRRSSC